MEKSSLKVGTSNGEFGVVVSVDMPTTLGDIARLAKCGDAVAEALDGMQKANPDKGTGFDYIVAKFMRGYRIDLQEGGARQVVIEKLAGKSAVLAMKDEVLVKATLAAVQAEIAAFDPSKPRARATRVVAPQQVVVTEGKTYSAAEVQAMLASLKGIQVEVK